jgi:hypothetical protein
MARASSGGNSSSSISISGWSRGTKIDALGLRLAILGRSDRPRRSVSASDIDEEDDRDDICMRPPSLGCGKVGTGEASFISVSDIGEVFHSKRSRTERNLRGPAWRFRMRWIFFGGGGESVQHAAFGVRGGLDLRIVGRNER